MRVATNEGRRLWDPLRRARLSRVLKQMAKTPGSLLLVARPGGTELSPQARAESPLVNSRSGANGRGAGGGHVVVCTTEVLTLRTGRLSGDAAI